MTPQQLMDLPHAGMAEKQLRDAGMWRICINDTERLDWIAENVSDMRRSSNTQSWTFETNCEKYDPDFFRVDIEYAASTHYMKEEIQ